MDPIIVEYDAKYRDQVFPELVPDKYFFKYTGSSFLYRFLTITGLFKSHFYLLLDGTKVCGCAVLRKRVSVKPTGLKWFIYGVAVKEDMRGRGFGSLLVEKLLYKGRSIKIKTIFLYVGMNNDKALNLYKKNGFVVVSFSGKDKKGRHAGEFLMKKVL